MAALPPPAAPHDQHDYQALPRSLLGYHLLPLLDGSDKLAVRGVSAQLRALPLPPALAPPHPSHTPPSFPPSHTPTPFSASQVDGRSPCGGRVRHRF
jgi:hypothetical protein